MTSIYLQLNLHKKYHNILFKNTQETNATSDKFEEKTKSSIIQNQLINYKIYKSNNYYLKRYENYFNKKLVIKYNVLPKEYHQIQLNNFILAKYCHSLASFKEILLYNNIEEFLKDYYKLKESKKEIPKYSEFYKSYLKFFCFPTFSELRLNDLIEEMVENKARVFYNENYKDEEKNINNDKYLYDTIIFTQKIKRELSRNNTLTDLSKTTIKNNNLSNKGSITSINTINKIINILSENKKKNNFTTINLNKNNYLLKKADNNTESKTERIHNLEKEDNNILNDNNTKCITDRNNKNIINIKKIINKDIIKIKNKNDIIKLTKNKHLISNLNKNKNLKEKIFNIKKNSNKNVVIDKKKGFDKNENNANKNKRIKINKNNIIKNLINFDNNNKNKTNKIKINEKKNGKSIEKENKYYNSSTNRINHKLKLGKFDKNFQTFLKIALNFNKISLKSKPTLFFKKTNNRNSKNSLTDRNKSNSLKKKTNITSININNLSQYIQNTKKNFFIKNKKKQKLLSRNYNLGFENIKTISIKTSIKSKVKHSISNISNTNINFINSSKKKLNKNTNIIKKYCCCLKNNTQKIINVSKKTSSLIKKERHLLTTIDLSQLNNKTKNKTKIKNFKTINEKKSFFVFK